MPDIPAAVPFDPMTEPEGFRAYQAGLKAGQAKENEACARTSGQTWLCSASRAQAAVIRARITP